MSNYRKLKINGETLSTHRVVWERAHGPIPEGYVVHHIDHDKLNNDLSNLELMTHQEHSEHHNQKHPRVKVCEFCGQSYEPHPTKRASSKTCSRECHGELTSRRQRESGHGRKLSDDQIAEIRRRRADGERGIDLAAEFDVAKSTISRLTRSA